MSDFFIYHIFRKYPELDASQIWNCGKTGFPTNARESSNNQGTLINVHFFIRSTCFHTDRNQSIDLS